MWRYLVRRAVLAVPVLFLVSAMTFFGTLLIPGDDLSIFYGTNVEAGFTVDQIQALRAQHGLDQPAPVRYVRWLTSALSGDLGMSLRAKEPVAA